MAISDYKITAVDLDGKGNIGMPDTPNLTTAEMQAKLDELSLEVIVPKFNELVGYMNDNLDLDRAITAKDITDLRLDADGKIQVSIDGGSSWLNAGASGHLIMNGSGTTFPTRSRMQFSSNVIIRDNEEKNLTFISIPSGEKGDKGDAATITVGTVEEGTEASFVNVGSSTDAIFDIVLPKGAKGDSASIQVGTVTSGQNPSVSNRGTAQDAIFDFVLPKGEQGDPGTGLTLLGHYDTLEQLQTAHPTGIRGNAYDVGITPDNTVYLWDPDTRAWKDVGSLKGAKGDTGAAGTITVGTVSEGETMAVENVGTSENAILNFTLKRGPKGETGNAATIAVGNVTSGDTPSVINTGTNTNAIFDFVLQRGPKGEPGEPTTINGKSGPNVTLFAENFTMGNYHKAEEYTEITEEDNILTAIGKLEARNEGDPTVEEKVDGIIGTDEEWNNTKSYLVGDMVLHNNKLWSCKLQHSGQKPPNETYWENVSLRQLNSNLNQKIKYSEEILGTFNSNGDYDLIQSVDNYDYFIIKTVVYGILLTSIPTKLNHNDIISSFYDGTIRKARIGFLNGARVRISDFSNLDYVEIVGVKVHQ